MQKATAIILSLLLFGGTSVSLQAGTGPSDHLSWTEINCSDGTPYPDHLIEDGTCAKLAGIFESLRDYCGCPLVVSSGYRTESHQRAIYKRLGQRPAMNSWHLKGGAIDIRRPRKYSRILDFHLAAGDWARGNQDVGAIGYYKWGIHVDIRPRKNGRLATWGSDAALRDTVN